jgi:VanZ family protein
MAKSELREQPKKMPRIISWVLVVALAALIFLLSSIPGSALLPGHPELLNVLAHGCLYALLGFLIAHALGYSKLALWKVVVIAVVLASLYGASDELHQYFVDGRFCDVWDWVTDTVGATVGSIVAVLVISAKIVSRSRKRDAER